MATVTVSLPDPMKDWIESQGSNGRYSGISDYIRDLIRKDQNMQDQREELIQALIEGEKGSINTISRKELRALARQGVGLNNDH